jgi:hypothetical protein
VSVASCTWPGSTARPTIEVTQSTGIGRGVEVASSNKSRWSSTGKMRTAVRSPEHFVISADVPRNFRIALSVVVRCSNTAGESAFRDTFEGGVQGPDRNALSIVLDVEVDHADRCAVDAVAHARPDWAPRARFPSVAHVALSCPRGCRIED